MPTKLRAAASPTLVYLPFSPWFKKSRIKLTNQSFRLLLFTLPTTKWVKIGEHIPYCRLALQSASASRLPSASSIGSSSSPLPQLPLPPLPPLSASSVVSFRWSGGRGGATACCALRSEGIISRWISRKMFSPNVSWARLTY